MIVAIIVSKGSSWEGRENQKTREPMGAMRIRDKGRCVHRDTLAGKAPRSEARFARVQDGLVAQEVEESLGPMLREGGVLHVKRLRAIVWFFPVRSYTASQRLSLL